MGVKSAHQIARKITGFSENQVRINVTQIRGGFGRRLETNYVEQAVIVSKTLKKPVQVFWSCEENIQNGFYRWSGIRRFQIGIDKEGTIKKPESQSVKPNIGALFVKSMIGSDTVSNLKQLDLI